MTRLIRVKSGKKYTFFLDGKRIYIRVEGELHQQYVLDTFTREKMNDMDFIKVIDSIYRKRITDTASFNEHIYTKFRLVPTMKRL